MTIVEDHPEEHSMSSRKRTRKVLTLNSPPYPYGPDYFEGSFPILIQRREETAPDEGKQIDDPELAAARDFDMSELEYLECFVLSEEVLSELRSWCEFHKEHFFVKGESKMGWDDTSNKEMFRSMGEAAVVSLRRELKDNYEVAPLNIRRYRSLRLMNDYTCKFPLWSGWRYREDIGVYSFEDLPPICDELKQQLYDWAAMFNEYFHYENGWDIDRASRDGATIERHEEEGERLREALEEELKADTSTYWLVSLDYWERGAAP